MAARIIIFALLLSMSLASAGGDFGGASADLGAAASSLGSMGADTIGGYGGSSTGLLIRDSNTDVFSMHVIYDS